MHKNSLSKKPLIKSPAQTELNLICTLLIASLVDNEANLPMLPKAFYPVINNSMETGEKELSLKHTAFINDTSDADEGCGHAAETC